MKFMATMKYLSLILAGCLAQGALHGALVIEGVLYDGPASTAKLRVEGLSSSTWKTPVAQANARIRLLEPGAERAWPLSTNAQGAFRIETDLPETTAGPFVVAVTLGDREYFTGSFGATPGKKIEVFAYPPGEDKSRVRTITKLVHTIEQSGNIYHLKVQCMVEFWNGGDSLFVGPRKDEGREVYRLPIPAGAVITKNEGMAPGTKWKKTSDGKFLVIDEPVMGLADLVAVRHEPGTRGWLVEYRVPATNLFHMSYPLSLAPMTRSEGQMDGFLVFVQEGDMNIQSNKPENDPDAKVSDSTQNILRGLTDLETGSASGVEGFREKSRLLEELYSSLRADLGQGGMKIDPAISKLQKFNNLVEKNPLDGAAQSYAVYGPSPGASLVAGSSLAVPIEISDVSVGQVSEKALLWHGGSISVILLAVLLGLAIGKKNGAQAVAAQIENLDTLDQIAHLDHLNSKGGIGEKEYQGRRKVLLEIAAGELESEAAPPAGQAGPAGLSQPTREHLQRVKDLDEGEDPDEKKKAERGGALEELYQSLKNDLEG